MWRIYVVVVLFASASCGAGFDDVGSGCSKCLVSPCSKFEIHIAIAASTMDQTHEILLLCSPLIEEMQKGDV